MAQFVSMPADLCSAFSGAVYRMTALPTDSFTDVAVVNADNGSTIGVKRFFAMPQVDVNISNYLTRLLDPQPAQGLSQCGILLSTGCSVKARVEVAGIASPDCRFVCSMVDESSGGILSQLRERTIGAGECDEITIACHAATLRAVFNVFSNGEEHEFELSHTFAESSVCRVVVAVDDVAVRCGCDAVDITEFGVNIFADTQMLGTVHYIVAESSPDAVRLCWLNRRGGFDCHTFNTLCRREMKVVKQRVLTEQGYRTVASRGRWSSEVSSDYLPRHIIEALGDSVASARVWRVDADAVVPVDICSEQVVSHSAGLSALELTVRESAFDSFQTI